MQMSINPTPVATAVVRPEQIASRIVDAILAGKLAAGARLGEQALADLFGVSRTLVREALARLAARGMVEVNSRRGWFIVQPSREHALEAFAAREAIETGMLQSLRAPMPAAAIRRLKRHVADERRALGSADAGERSFRLGDFHVCLAECAGNGLLADILRDLTARTTLIATLYQSTQDASVSCAEHGEIVAALQAGDHARAARLMRRHIQSVATTLGHEVSADDPLAPLRAALSPLRAALTASGAQTGSPPARPPPASRTGRTRLARNPVAQDLQASMASEQPAPRRLFSDLLAPAKRAVGKARKTERSTHGDTQ